MPRGGTDEQPCGAVAARRGCGRAEGLVREQDRGGQSRVGATDQPGDDLPAALSGFRLLADRLLAPGRPGNPRPRRHPCPLNTNVMLLTVLMFPATSVTLDEVLALAPTRGIACFIAGLAFAFVVSEGMLRGVNLALPLAFRVSYYLMLALFYLYPVALVPLLEPPGNRLLEWALFGFYPIAGLVVLTLLPAVRRGRDYV